MGWALAESDGMGINGRTTRGVKSVLGRGNHNTTHHFLPWSSNNFKLSPVLQQFQTLPQPLNPDPGDWQSSPPRVWVSVDWPNDVPAGPRNPQPNYASPVQRPPTILRHNLLSVPHPSPKLRPLRRVLPPWPSPTPSRGTSRSSPARATSLSCAPPCRPWRCARPCAPPTSSSRARTTTTRRPRTLQPRGGKRASSPLSLFFSRMFC